MYASCSTCMSGWGSMTIPLPISPSICGIATGASGVIGAMRFGGCGMTTSPQLAASTASASTQTHTREGE